MEISTLSNNKIADIYSSASIQQAADSPHTDAQSSLTSTASCEGCFTQIMNFIRGFIDWVASFFCLSKEEKKLPEGIQSLKEKMAGQEGFFELKEGPVSLLENMTLIFSQEPLGEFKKQFPTALAHIIYDIEKNSDAFEGSKAADFYLTIGSELSRTGMLDEKMILQKFASHGMKIDDAVKKQLQDLIFNHNNRETIASNKLYESVVTRFTSHEELKKVGDKNGYITLVNELIDAYRNTKNLPKDCPNMLSFIINLIKKERKISDSFTRTFYLCAGQDLLKNGKLDKGIIMKFNAAPEIQGDLLRIIRDFNK